LSVDSARLPEAGRWRSLVDFYMGAQAVWVGIGLVLFHFAWRAAVKHFSAVGG
jgi:hypothetical protein